MHLCALTKPDLLIPLVQGGYPAGRSYQGKFVQALRCPHCAYICFPTPESEVLNKYYTEEYPRASASWYNVDSDYSEWKMATRSQRIETLMQPHGFGRGAVLHEFGCAFGGTVEALKRKGYKASGTELNAEAVAAGRKRGNLDVHAEDAIGFLRRTAEKPDVVYSWHAIEHFTAPLHFLAELGRQIKPGGLLILIVPSSAARFPMVYGHSRYVWFGYPEHLHLFSPGAAPAIAASIGLQLVHVSTSEYGIEPEATRAALSRESEAARWLRLGDPQLLGEELVLVFRRNADPSTLPSDVERQLLLRCDLAASVERRVLDALEQTAVDPWAKARVA